MVWFAVSNSNSLPDKVVRIASWDKMGSSEISEESGKRMQQIRFFIKPYELVAEK